MKDSLLPYSVRHISLCADDFGRNDGACRAALQLAAVGAISATSVLVDGPATRKFAAGLREHANQLTIGLHLNLTESWAGHGAKHAPRRAIMWWILASTLPAALPYDAARSEIRRQLQLFMTHFHRPPDFVDGHEHVHQLAGVREPLLAELADKSIAVNTVRITVPRRWRGFKAALIGSLGGRPFERLARAQGLRMNTDFAGAYDFSSRRPFGNRMEHWLATLATGGLIMCHPEIGDGVSNTARVNEFEWLRSARWPEVLAAQQVAIVPFARTSLLAT